MNILIVDDETAALSNFFNKIMGDPMWEYTMLKDPEAAIEYAKIRKPTAAFLDINMPKTDGVTLAKKLIKINPAISIVFISSYAQDENAICKSLGDNLLGFCYKPYNTDNLYKYLHQIATNGKIKADIKAFGVFDIFIMGKAIRFSSAKSKEILAFLIHNGGRRVTMNVCITALWPDKPLDLAKRLYRDAVIRLRIALKKVGLSDLVHFYRAELAINRECIADCDFYHAEETGDYSAYHGEYMTQYGEWSLEGQGELDRVI